MVNKFLKAAATPNTININKNRGLVANLSSKNFPAAILKKIVINKFKPICEISPINPKKLFNVISPALAQLFYANYAKIFLVISYDIYKFIRK